MKRLLALAALAVGAQGAAAQLVQPIPGSGQVGLELRGARTGFDASSLDAQQWIQFGVRGGLWNQRLLRYRLTVRPEWRQGSLTGVEGELGGRALGLAAAADLLPGRPVSLRLGATRAAGTQAAGFGNVRTFTTGAQTVDATWSSRYFPTRVAWRRQTISDVWRYADGASPRPVANGHQTLRLTAASSKTSVALERQWFDDRVGSEDFTAWSALVSHTLRWGRGSRLESVFERSSQDGARGTLRSLWGERLHLVHSAAVSSDWVWRRSRTALPGQESRGHTFDGTMHAQLTSWGAAALQGGIATGGGTAAYRTVTLTPRFGLHLPLGGLRLGSSLAAGGEWRRGAEGADTLGQIVDERQTLGPDRRLLLNEPRAVPASVILRGPDGVLLVEGLDYVLVPFGDRLRVEFPVNSRVPDGSTVTASYAYTLSGIRSRNAFRVDADLWATWDGITLRYAESRRSIAAGTDQTDAFRESRATLDLRRNTGFGRLSVGVALTGRQGADRPATTSTDLNADLARTLGRHVQATVAATWSRAVAGDGPPLLVRTGEVGLSWLPTTTVQGQVRAAATRWQGMGGERQSFLSVISDVTWRYAGMDMHARWDATRRDQGSVLWLHRVTATVVRRF